ncbi:uncharacterized protein LOC111049921 isoform X2 [Nilaparvata lugens]|nr:uncharacterized protein LOC111049921 isoform X2 [Nilaparvata lugens]XP_039294960.1 uncharacterized protein LOC111049921 isoform X2 [Nilaparvata lugens]
MPGAQNYMRSAPFRRLRHPLDESPAWTLLGSLLWSLLAFFLALPLLLVLALLLPAAYVLRWLLLMLYWNRRRSQAASGGAESMRGTESRWLGDSWQRSVVHAVLVFDSPPAVTDLRHLFLSRVLPLCPRLARRPLALPTVGHCWLPDSHFNIDNHVYARDIVNEAHLQEYVSGLVCEGLASDRPPWELRVVGRCAILRVHQSVADGAALVTLLCRCLADSPVKPRLQAQRHALGFYCDMLRACLLGPLTLLFWLLVSTSDCNLLTSHRQTVASSGSQGSQVKVTWSAAISFAKVTRVKQVTRSTVNCVLLSALSGALRCLLQSCGVRQPPDLKIVLPVDLGHCSNPSAELRLGSRVAPVAMTLPVNTEGAVPRLWSTRRTLSALRRSADPLIVYLATTTLMSLLPGHFARHVLSNIVENKASLQFSSQQGPPTRVQVGGCTLTSVYALLPAQSQLSVAVSVFTYDDQLSVTVATDSTLGPAGRLLIHHLQAQIESLYELLKNRRAPGESKNENNLYRFPDVTRSPVREIAHRLNHVQEEVRRLSHHDSSEPERLQRLKAEFSHLLRELRKRKSSGAGSPDQDVDDWDKKLRSRRRSMSCSFSRRPSSTLIGLISYNKRPISCIESSSSVNPPHTSPSGNRSQTRRNTTGCTQPMSSSSSSSSTSHSSNSSCNRRTSTPIFSPVIDRQRLTEIKESPTRPSSEDGKRQTFVKSYSQPSVMPHDVQREISCSNSNLLKAASYHSQPVFRISEESPFVVPKVLPSNESYNLRRKLLERNIYPDYNSYITSRQSSVPHRAEDARTNRKLDDRPVSSSLVYCDYNNDQHHDARSLKRTTDDPGMQAYPSKYSFESELYDEILYVIKDNEQLSSLYSGCFDSPRECTLRTTRIDSCDQEDVRSTYMSSTPSPSSSQWVSSESRYNQYMAEAAQPSSSKHQVAGYSSSPKESYSWRSYDKKRKHDEEQLSSSSSSVSSPMRHHKRSSIFGRYRKFFNDVDDDEIVGSNMELSQHHGGGNKVHCYEQEVGYDNQGSGSPYSPQSGQGSRGYREAIDNLSDFANTVHKFGSSSRVEASNCGVHYNPKSQVRSTSSSKSSLLSSQSYGFSDKSRDVSPSSRSSPMNRSRSPLTTLSEETRLTSTLALDDNQTGQEYVSQRGRVREVSAEDQPSRFLRDRQYDKALSYFVTQKINSSSFQNRQADTAYHLTPSASPNSASPYNTTRQQQHLRSPLGQQHPRSPLGDHLPHVEVLESSSTMYVPKYKQSSSTSPKSNSTLEPSQVTLNMDHGPSQSDRTVFTTSLPLLSSSSSSSSNSIVSFMRIPFDDDPNGSSGGANASSGYRPKKTNYSYNNKGYDNDQDKVAFI